MKTRNLHVFLAISIVYMVIGCTPTNSNSAITIPSFREYYPLLLKEAQKWRPDAYLDEARIFLFPNFSDSYLISAGFNSGSESSESLAVDLYQDGTIASKVFAQKYDIYQHKPIAENDWRIDSQQAIEYILGDSGRLFVDPDKNACSYLVLKRILPLQDQPVVWSLTLWDCQDLVQHFYMDAITGELLNSAAVNIIPTRFPTPTP